MLSGHKLGESKVWHDSTADESADPAQTRGKPGLVDQNLRCPSASPWRARFVRAKKRIRLLARHKLVENQSSCGRKLVESRGCWGPKVDKGAGPAQARGEPEYADQNYAVWTQSS